VSFVVVLEVRRQVGAYTGQEFVEVGGETSLRRSAFIAVARNWRQEAGGKCRVDALEEFEENEQPELQNNESSETVY
jgi:hypothetical protein